MTRCCQLLFCLLLCCATPFSWGQAVNVIIDEQFVDQMIGKNVEYLATQPTSNSQWLRYDAQSIALGTQDGTYWFRFNLSNHSKHNQTLMLEIKNPLLDRVELTQRSGGQVINTQKIGDLLPFHQRLIEHERLLLPIKLAAGQRSEILLKVSNDGLFDLPMHLWQQNHFIEHNSRTNLQLGMFFGFLLATLFSCFLLYGVTRARKFAKLGVVLSIETLALMTQFGIGNRFFWPDWPWLQQHILAILMALTLISGALFGLSLLNMRRVSRRILQIVRALIAVGGILVLLSLFMAVHITIVILLLYAVLLAATMLVVGIWCWRKKVNAAELFTISWAVSTLSFLYVTLSTGLNISLPVATLDVFVFNAAASTVLLFVALIRQYIGDKAEKMAQQQKAIAEISVHEKMQKEMLIVEEKSRQALEVKIQERTFELEVTLRELEEKNQELEQKNTQDALTGIRNRRFFDKKYLAEFRRSRREQTELSLIMLDIDHFKAVNDTHGHLAGDDVIRYVGRAIQDMLKRPSDDACRYGGEEFAVILPSTTVEGARQLAEKIRQTIAQANIETHCGSLNITVSCGICTQVADTGMSDNHYIDMADKSLYVAKQQGRNCVIHCSDNAVIQATSSVDNSTDNSSDNSSDNLSDNPNDSPSDNQANNHSDDTPDTL